MYSCNFQHITPTIDKSRATSWKYEKKITARLLFDYRGASGDLSAHDVTWTLQHSIKEKNNHVILIFTQNEFDLIFFSDMRFIYISYP